MNLIRNMRLSVKITVLSLSFFIFLAVIGAASIKQLSTVNSKLLELNDSRLVPIVKLQSIVSDVEYIRSQSNSLMDAGSDDSVKKPIQEDIEARAASVTEKISEYKNNEEYKTLIESFNNFIAAKDAFIKANGVGTTKVVGGSQATAGASQGSAPTEMVNYDTAKKAFVEVFDKIIDKQVANAKTTYDESKAVYKQTIIAIISLISICAAITLILSVIITKSIISPVKSVTNKLKEISNNGGDLTQRIGYESKDEIGDLSRSFDLFIEKLQGIIREVATSAETIASSSEQLSTATASTTQSLEDISNTIVEIASSTSEGAAVTEETTASLQEMANFSESTASASRNTAVNSKKAKEAAEDGSEKISEVIDSITEIASSSKEVSSMINELDESSRKIGDIIQIITSISEQTNLLALNAAIEAARAGEAGRGFSVVADEIRKLADESNNAARQISELVKENQLKSASTVTSVNHVEEKVSLGVNIASEVGESIKNIIDNIQNIVNEIEQIDDANDRQAKSTKEMEKAISNLATTSNEVAEGTENISTGIEEQLTTMTEIETTTEQLSEMAKRLTELTSGFKV
ncbi:putative methyl-accepting chemotaxis protein YoaH [Clostridium homopropionicum DSM 5847]|uniref:Putative methyl-accepting chemotaxis protein YoaH n=1 Tax=Clostridium homopropionicum DSM 5847 TaxID=1121318 RepID=A0A0L6ZBJ7_9CLOT|nr:HAMP domain-containing methyl-accepting chemotaxis protein [Clostridium homopropionicum]KOA20354.1 putative methyl-accepting chemotaxis protein YoaH [Clostridium homopropionicum DSM 5847]SFG73924.1 methyl-accepting chemotaxis protein [Clostridium homopropionicum]